MIVYWQAVLTTASESLQPDSLRLVWLSNSSLTCNDGTQAGYATLSSIPIGIKRNVISKSHFYYTIYSSVSSGTTFVEEPTLITGWYISKAVATAGTQRPVPRDGDDDQPSCPPRGGPENVVPLPYYPWIQKLILSGTHQTMFYSPTALVTCG